MMNEIINIGVGTDVKLTARLVDAQGNAINLNQVTELRAVIYNGDRQRTLSDYNIVDDTSVEFVLRSGTELTAGDQIAISMAIRYKKDGFVNSTPIIEIIHRGWVGEEITPMAMPMAVVNSAITAQFTISVPPAVYYAGASPRIGANGHWYIFDDVTKEYVDTNFGANLSNEQIISDETERRRQEAIRVAAETQREVRMREVENKVTDIGRDLGYFRTDVDARIAPTPDGVEMKGSDDADQIVKLSLSTKNARPKFVRNNTPKELALKEDVDTVSKNMSDMLYTGRDASTDSNFVFVKTAKNSAGKSAKLGVNTSGSASVEVMEDGKPNKVYELPNRTYVDEEVKKVADKSAQLEQDVKGINTEITEMWEAINSGEEGDWYGVTRKTSQASPELTRIGNMNNHRILPFHNRISPCIVDKDRNVVYWLDRQDIRKKADGTPSKLDGTDGQCCVYVPEGYYLDHAKGKDYANQDMDNDITAIGLRPFSYMGEHAKHFPAFFVSMDICTVQRSTNKLMCCYNDTADFAGSGSKATAGGVGKARTALNHDTFFNYARNYGSGWTNTYYPAWQIISALMRIEYATYNLKKPMIKDKTDEGYTQGGLGEGPVNWTSQEWSDYNGYYPVRNILDTHISACNQQSMFGIATDGTHMDRASFRIGDTTKYTEFNTWRWIGNIWGHIWHYCCGVYVHTQGSADGNESILYVANNPDDCVSAASSFDYVNRYQRVGVVPRSSGYIKETYPYVSISNTLGAGSSTYMCAHWWGIPPADPAISETRCLLLGADLGTGGSASRSAALSHYRPSHADSAIGSGLFAIANKS